MEEYPSSNGFPSASRRSSGSPREDSPSRSKSKRHQIAVACNACRKRKTKCDGIRPICGVCVTKKTPCQWSADPDATPMIAMKRKYDTLESESRDLQSLVQMLMDRPRQEAFTILDHLRRTRDTSSTLSFVRDGDLLAWGRLGTSTDPESNAQRRSSWEPDELRQLTEKVDSLMPNNARLRDVNPEGVDAPGKASRSRKNGLAISDLVNNNVNNKLRVQHGGNDPPHTHKSPHPIGPPYKLPMIEDMLMGKVKAPSIRRLSSWLPGTEAADIHE